MSTDLFEVIDGTWPAARFIRHDPWMLRAGEGGGSRVSAATAEGLIRDSDIPAAEAGMRELGQDPLFMIRPGDEALDAMLEARGYTVADPVIAYSCPVEHLTDIALPQVRVLHVWEPLAIMCEIWEAGGIGPARLAVMKRVHGPKTGLLGRFRDKPGGTGFVAMHQGTAMVHALEILPHQRKQGLGGWMMRGAALWAQAQGADTLSVMCTKANIGANALYSRLGMCVVGEYYYRRAPQEEKTS